MSLKYFYELCTSKVIITNYRTTDLFVKRKGQYYVQTWHSSLRLKKIEKDAESDLPPHYVKMAKKDSLKCDLLLSGCKYSTTIFKQSFWYEGEILEYGTPRNDLLLKADSKQSNEIRKQLMIPTDTRVLLYAPTFRKKNSTSVYNINYQDLRKTLQTKFGGEWVILIRFHPHLLSEANQIVFDDNIMNVTSYDDIQELLLISDVLISDYSSLIFDFGITSRPCFLYVPDLKEYTSSERELYFNMKDLPFINATTNRDLLTKIEQFNAKEYTEDLNDFLDQIGSFEDGRASEYLLKRINNVCYRNEESDMNEAV
jgi:CDP-glycerol glycerophosphotransferase